MRSLLAILLICGGAWSASQPWLPEAARLDRFVSVPSALTTVMRPAGALCAALGVVLLLLPRRRSAGLPSDDTIVATLTRSGFRFDHHTDGWLAQGAWRGVPVVVRRGSGREAARFARPWVIVVSLPGRPAEPWPLPPSQGGIIEIRPEGFSVSLPDLSSPDQQSRLAQRLDTIIASRH